MCPPLTPTLVGASAALETRACQRSVPGTGCVSLGKVSSKGLNTESNNTQRATATALVGVDGERHCRDEHTVLPRFRALLER